MANKNKRTSIFTVVVWLIIFFPVGLYFLIKRDKENNGKQFKTSGKITYLAICMLCFDAVLFMSVVGSRITATDEKLSTDAQELLSETIKSQNQILLFFSCITVILFIAIFIFKIKEKNSKAEIYENYGSQVHQTTYQNHQQNQVKSNQNLSEEDLIILNNTFSEGMELMKEAMNSSFSNEAFTTTQTVTRTINYNGNVYQTAQNQNNKKIDPVTNVPVEKVVTCKNCGANNKVIQGQVKDCDFCGTLIQE